MPITEDFLPIQAIENIDPSFLTHANYIDFMCDESKNISLTITNKLNNEIRKENSLLVKRVRLSILTMENLSAEISVINKNIDYAVVCSSWVPVKSYYIFYNLGTVLQYLIKCDDSVLTSTTHRGLMRWLKTIIENNELQFSNDVFNKVYRIPEINEWKFRSGNNLATVNHQDRDKQLIKKLQEYSRDEFKRSNKKKSLRGSLKDQFERQTKISLCDFFYWYRIKVNYRDLEFLDSSADELQFYLFYQHYYKCTYNFYMAFVKEINRLSQIRLSRNLYQIERR